MTDAEGNPGYRAGMGRGSKNQRLGWALKGAPLRTKDLRLNALGGIVEGRKLRDKVTALMLKKEANPEDAMVYCVFAEPELSGAAFIDGKPDTVAVLPLTNGTADLELAKKFVGKLPIGFLVFVLDTADTERHVFGHTRPLIVTDKRAVAMMDKALESVTHTIKRRMGLLRGEN
jgi:hypothetical protein